jgi:hypothetical protein
MSRGGGYWNDTFVRSVKAASVTCIRFDPGIFVVHEFAIDGAERMNDRAAGPDLCFADVAR